MVPPNSPPERINTESRSEVLVIVNELVSTFLLQPSAVSIPGVTLGGIWLA